MATTMTRDLGLRQPQPAHHQPGPIRLHPSQSIALATTARPHALPPKQPTRPPSPDCRNWATPTAGTGQGNLSSPQPGQSTSGVRSQLFNNSGQPTIGPSPRPIPISAGRFNSKDAAQVNNHAVLSMAQSLLQSGAIHLTGTDLTVAQVSAFIESVEKKLCTHPRYGDHDRSRKLEDSEGTAPELPDAQEQQGATSGTWTLSSRH